MSNFGGSLHFSKEWTIEEECHYHTCNDPDCDQISSYGEHTFVEKVTKQPTCTETGTKAQVCSACDYIKPNTTETVDKVPHTYLDPEYEWSDDYMSCTATATCSCGDIFTETSETVITVKKQPTCITNRIDLYTITFESDVFDTQTHDVTVDNTKIAHTYEITYTWNDETKKCTASRHCTTDGCDEGVSETVQGTYVSVGINETVITNRFDKYKAEFENSYFEDQIENIEIPNTLHIHTFDTPTYVWSSDYKTCTAKRVCTSDICNDYEEEISNSTETILYEETLNENRISKYTSEYENDGFTTQTINYYEVPASSLKVAYTFVEFIWDGQKATVYLKNNSDSSITKSLPASVERIYQNSLGNSQQEIILEASYDEYSDNKTLTVTCVNHEYSFDHFVYDKSNNPIKSCRYCINCHNNDTRNQYYTIDNTAIINNQSCYQYGIKQIKATYKCGSEKVTNNISVLIPKNSNHEYGTLIPAVEATSTKDGNIAYYHCELCDKYFNSSKEEVDTIVKQYTTFVDTLETKGTLEASDTLDYIPTYSTSQDYDLKNYTVSNGTTTYDLSTIYDGYYSFGLTWTNSEDLLNKLNKLITNNHTFKNWLAYNGNFETNIYADTSLYNENFVNTVYSTYDIYADRTDSGWQREHAWCASLMTGFETGLATETKGRATDFHNLFAAYASGNMSRGNRNYGNVSTNDSGYKNYIYDGVIQYEYTGKTFEPNDEDKGRLARAIFYMATMYMAIDGDNAIDSMHGLSIVEENIEYKAGDSNTFYKIGNLSDLLEWSKYYVDRSEFQHNEMVYGHINSGNTVAQGNRNPFVDFPELVEYAFGSKKNQSGSLNKLVPSYVDLDLDNNNTFCYSVDVNNYQIDEDTVISKDDFTVFAVSEYTGDYTTHIYKYTEITNYTLIGLNDSNKFDLVGQNVLTVKIGDETIDLNILYQDKYLQDCYYSLDFTKDMFSGIDSDTDTDIILNNTSWTINIYDNISLKSNKTFGVQIGESKKPISTITLTSKYKFNCDNRYKLNNVYLKGSTASGKTYTIRISILDDQGNEIITTDDLSFKYIDKDSLVLAKLENIGGIYGHIQIKITGITEALYLHSLGVDLS